MEEIFVELTQSDEKNIKAQLRKHANALCVEYAKAYMDCINGTLMVWKCSPELEKYQECFKKHASEEHLFQARVDFLEKKRQKLASRLEAPANEKHEA
jgi:hypothetical protein